MAQQKNASGKPIKVLSVVWFNVLPARYGGQNAVACFNSHVGQLVPLICLCSKANNPAAAENYVAVNTLPNSKWQFLNPVVWWRIMAVAKKEKVTHVMLEFPYHGLAGLLCKWLLGKQLVVRMHNVEHQRFRQMGKWWWSLLWLYEGIVLKCADYTFTLTKEDKTSLIKNFRLSEQHCEYTFCGTSHNGQTDTEAATEKVRNRHHLTTGEKLLLFAGTLDYEPNTDAMVDIYEQVLPRLDEEGLHYRFLVAGRNRHPGFEYITQISHPRLLMLGEVENITEYMAACDAFVNPVTWGGGAQTKTIDALTQHANVVCFKAQARTLLSVGDKLRITPNGDWDEFHANIKRALSFKEPTGRFFLFLYNWRNIAEGVVQLLPPVR